jgi:hypothetical protein
MLARCAAENVRIKDLRQAAAGADPSASHLGKPSELVTIPAAPETFVAHLGLHGSRVYRRDVDRSGTRSSADPSTFVKVRRPSILLGTVGGVA